MVASKTRGKRREEEKKEEEKGGGGEEARDDKHEMGGGGCLAKGLGRCKKEMGKSLDYG